MCRIPGLVRLSWSGAAHHHKKGETAMASIVKTLAAGALALMLGLSAASAEVVYNRGTAADPETLDPHKTSTTYEADIMRDLFDGLVMPDSKANLIPGAAESWTISPDGLVYTFKMRQGAKWSNGDPVTAEDFVYSMRRMVSKDLGAEYASILYPIKNAEEVNSGKVPPEEMGVKALDPMTLRRGEAHGLHEDVGGAGAADDAVVLRGVGHGSRVRGAGAAHDTRRGAAAGAATTPRAAGFVARARPKARQASRIRRR